MVTSERDLAVEPLDGRRHDRASFTCGAAALDLYLKAHATQDIRRKANAVFVLVARADPKAVLGYFTLCAASLAPGIVPDEARKHLPRYPIVSATLLGRLAVADSHQGKGLGGVLLVRALRKAYENADIVGASMVVVDALDERAAGFYAAHGFIRLPESMRLVLPMQTLPSCSAFAPSPLEAKLVQSSLRLPPSQSRAPLTPAMSRFRPSYSASALLLSLVARFGHHAVHHPRHAE